MEISAIDLFCGAGGLTRGLLDSGITVKAGFDIDESCRFAYESNNEGAVFHNIDIADVDPVTISGLYGDATVKILAGCAPCQPFSRFTYRDKNRENSTRWRLLEEFARIVEGVKPDIISMENVPDLEGKKPFRTFYDTLIHNGYSVSYSIVDCSKYGVPQNRRRLVLLASRFGPISLVPPTHEEPVTVMEKLHDLEVLEAGEKSENDPYHRCQKLMEINLKRIRNSKPGKTWEDWPDELKLKCHKKERGKSFRAVYGRMEWDQPAPTITTQFFNYGSGRFGHPEQDRALSLREGALLQSFSPSYRFTEDDDYNLANVATHIGNAVPVRLGEVIGYSILEHLEENNVKIQNED